ncbi:flagellar assembly protein FliT [Ureibacillus massiliensis 4400831 = CIP 108448 = CCUG 49529]|uniref:Flagellar protein FliT n=1 Tax=Ureibacillus massiliensis 4400831 = CIP 108448 = CCUG 49529 TaxID=1211035 RepID=A0A0A3JSW3_9BACL|nr:flagellar protein FliT [Ureibacillus massiliensis]KGR90107.1 flagellar assembly protein FliT [Ureibacillus massiliensis 4400831 = CIP 108448 = CCUG 49529]
MDKTQQLVQTSALLFKHLAEIPTGEKRTQYIETINQLLDNRGLLIEQLRNEGFQMDENDKTHATLAKLDNGIRERLDLVMQAIKQDMKDLQNTKKHERQYMNPYSSVQVMDGKYYDKKK